jgi:hypothetical protein
MLNRMSLAAVLLTATCRYAPALVNVYHVTPVKAAWSGWTQRGVAVSQTLTCNFDSLSYVELFAGTKYADRAYTATILEDGTPLMSSQGNQVADHGWVSFENWDSQTAFTKGKQYELRFTRGADDSMEYYYDGTNPYSCGYMRFDRADETDRDICCRVYGRLNAVDTTWLSVQIHLETDGLDSALMSAHRLGIRSLGDDLGHWNAWKNDPAGVRQRCSTYTAMGFEVRGMLAYGNPNDSLIASAPFGVPVSQIGAYPPRNLFAPLTDDTNYWAGYCRGIMDGLASIKYWAVWGEPNAGWNWNDPDIKYYHGSGGVNDPIDTPRERCSLYVQMCHIAKQTALTLGHDQKVIGGYVWRLLIGGTDPRGDTIVATGKSWLRHMFGLVENPSFGGVEKCFDVVGVDPYMHHVVSGEDSLWFDESKFEADLDTARTVMQDAGHGGMELWALEMGWPRWRHQGDAVNPPRQLTDPLMQARDLCQFVVSAQARRTDPRGGYDRVNWYELASHRGSPRADSATEGFGLLDTNATQTPLSQWWAMRHIGEQLVHKRCSGRVTYGDTVVDNRVRMYEFEDPTTLQRTWVCWRNGEDERSVGVKLPVRTNSLSAESLAYSSTPPGFSPKVNDDGWLSMNLDSRPVFISEKTAPQRPDLGVDSVRFVQAGSIVRAWVTNHGTRATPVRSGSRVPYPTWAVLRANGDSLSQQVRTTTIAVSQQVVFEFALGQTDLPDTALLSVTVNPNQAYVELGTDDNTGYALVAKP